ncbi:MAG: hypothetical protein RLZ25_584 [Pseudomonadota bacterium]|jgi:glycosyltransferase involved in cell wall biosynthesis
MLIHDYYPRVGGAQALLRVQASKLRARGIEVDILTRGVAGEAAFEKIDGVSVYRLPVPRPRALASVSFLLSALRLMSKLKPDVVHAHEFISPATAAVLGNAFLKLPMVVTPHRSGPLGDVQRLQNRSGGAYRLREIRDRADALVVISREIGNELIQADFPIERLHDIRNGVDTECFKPLAEAEKSALRRAIGLPNKIPIVIYSGRLVQEKRVHHLLAVWPRVLKTNPKALLLILGEGDQDHSLRAMATPGVLFLGAITNVRLYLQAGDIFVLPSAAEGLSVSMLEAMSSGLAPIVTAVGGAPEVITHRQDGLLIAPDDLEELETALQMLIKSNDMTSELGKAARERVLAHFSVDQSVEALAHLYEMLSNPHRS